MGVKIIITETQYKNLKKFISESELNYYQAPIEEDNDDANINLDLKDIEDILKSQSEIVKTKPINIDGRNFYLKNNEDVAAMIYQRSKANNENTEFVSFIDDLLSSDFGDTNTKDKVDDYSKFLNKKNFDVLYKQPNFGKAVGLDPAKKLVNKYVNKDFAYAQIQNFEPVAGEEHIQFDYTKKLNGLIQTIHRGDNLIKLYTFKYNNRLYGVTLKDDFTGYEDIKGDLYRLTTKDEKIQYDKPDKLGSVEMIIKGGI